MATIKRPENITIENTNRFKSNFKGEPEEYNKRGGRPHFLVYVDDPKIRERMENEGWNLKMLAPREEGEEPKYIIDIAVNYPADYERLWPRIVMITGKHMTELSQGEIGILDKGRWTSCDVIIRPRIWTNDDGEEKIKAYLSELWVVMEESRLEQKYYAEYSVGTDEEPLPFK